MKGKRAGLILAGTVALCFVAVAPSQVADGRLPRWMNLIEDARRGFHHLAEGLADALHLRTKPPVPPKRIASGLDPIGIAAPPSLGKPQAAKDAAALSQAYGIAISNERIRSLGFDPAGIVNAIAAYRTDDLVGGDAIARAIGDPEIRTALEWVALRDEQQKIGLDRLNAFIEAHRDWPASAWFRHQQEARMLRSQDVKLVETFFSARAPVTAVGGFALAKALKSEGRAADAAKIARALYRDSDLSGFLEAKIKSDFGSDLTKADHKFRADRLLYKDQPAAAMRAAALAGPDVVALERARSTIAAESSGDKAATDRALGPVPPGLRSDPGLMLAEAQAYRRADRLKEAVALMQAAPRDPAVLIDGDEWWTERRVLARRLLDTNNAIAAYLMCANHDAQSREARVDAEFHAGWIALRFLNDPARAAWHLALAAKLTETPTSIARIAYWQGRTAGNMTDADAPRRAIAFYRQAAVHGSTYHGQLARDALGLTSDPVKEPAREATGADRVEAVRVVELLYAAGEKDSAFALATDAANTLTDESQIAALASVIARQQDAHLALTIGKLVGQRGMSVDPLAFPTFGIPPYDALRNSAAPSVVYSIARQESAFLPAVVSKAGAKGLMQMIDSTARSTATKAGLPFDGNRMLTDAAFNAQLGAAHLGALLAEQGGSYILTFAAYNAGGGRVRQWIDAYGDPRDAGVDPIDWVERIPFTETRNYVQRVMANVTMYKAIFAARDRMRAGIDRQAKL